MSKLYTADKFVTIGGTTAQYVTGTGSLVTFPTIPSGSDYIQNQIASAQSANMWISGSAYINGNVGVGTSTPAFKLDILSSDPRIRIKDSSNGYSIIDMDGGSGSFYVGSDNSTGSAFGGSAYAGTIYRSGAYPIAMWTNGAERMRVTSTGNVGIGTTSPSGNLHVYNSSSPTLIYNQNYNGVQSYWNSSDGGIVYFGSTTNHPLAFVTNNTEKMRITSTGNVGIGTTSPNSTLSVGSSDAGAVITSGGANTHLSLKAMGSAGELIFGAGGVSNGTAGSERMRINSAGNVGIGTTAPSTKLDVVGTANTFASIGTTGASSGRALLFQDKKVTATKYNWLIGAQYNIDNAFEITPSTAIGGSTYSTPSVTILQSGNVGIGTTSPNSKLSISYSSAVVDALNIVNTNTNGRSWYVGDGAGVVAGTFGFYDATAALSRLVINASGNVGIGATSPVSIGTGITTLDIQGSAAGGIAFGLSGTKNYIYGASTMYVEANTTAVFATSGSEKMRITSAGNVGIGTTSPSSPLDVQCNSSALGINIRQRSGNDFANLVFSDTSNTGLGSVGYVGTSRLRFTTNGLGDANEKLSILANGNVGIGTIAPSIKLQVETSVNGSDGLWVRNTNTGTSAFGSINCVSGVGAINLRAYSAAHAAWPSTSMINSASAFTGGMALFQDGANPISLWTNGSERMRVTSAGNVGIGTTSPSGQLDVYNSPYQRLALIYPSTYLTKLEIGGNSYIQQDAANEELKIVQEYGGGKITFSTNATEKMRITSAGNVGIGTTSPNEKLTVSGKIYANPQQPVVLSGQGAPYYGTNITLASDIGSTQGANRIWSRYDGTGSGAITFERSTNSQAYNSDPQLLTYTESMRIAGNGNVGIGTTSPSQKLSIVGGSSTYAQVNNGSNSIYLGQISSYGLIQSDLDLALLSGGSERMRITSGGNVGIGTTTPAAKLTVEGILATKPAGVDAYYSYLRSNWSADNAFELGISAFGSSIYHKLITSSGYYNGETLQFWTNDSERARFDISGNFGIGTTSPTEKLQVSGNSIITGNLSIGSSSSYGKLNLATTSFGTQTMAFVVADGTQNPRALISYITASGSQRVNFSSSYSTGSTLSNWTFETGNVGIGTSSPSAALNVVTTAAVTAIFTRDLATDATLRILGDSDGSIIDTQGIHNLRFFTNDAERMRITSAGNVGIGTSAPGAKLEVVSSTSSNTAPISIVSSSNSYGAWIKYAQGSSYQWYTGITSGSDFVIDDVNIGTSRLIVKNTSGNVGIGTTSPASKLDVNGDALINQLTIGQGPVVGQGNTALGKGALGSMVGGKANIAVGSNANSDNDVTGLTVIGVDLNVNPAGSALTQNSLVIGQYNALNYSTQYPHIYAPDKVNCPNGNTTTDVIAVDYSVYTAIFMEYSIFNSAGDQFRAGTYTAAFKSTGTVVDDDNQTVVYSGTTLSATFTTSISGSVATIQLRNQDSDTYDIRVTARLLMR